MPYKNIWVLSWLVASSLDDYYGIPSVVKDKPPSHLSRKGEGRNERQERLYAVTTVLRVLGHAICHPAPLLMKSTLAGGILTW
jgi:hypothetical protein